MNRGTPSRGGLGRIALLAGLAGCAAPHAVLGAPARPAPLLSLPEAGRPTLVAETRRPGGLTQRIALGRAGAVRADLVLGIAGTEAGLAMAKPTKRGIEAELAALPGGPYRVLGQPSRNAYGPVGIALSGTCAFAWQWIDDLRGIEPEAGLAAGRVSASLRVHRCGPSADALAGEVARLRLGVVAPGPSARAPRRRHPRPPGAVETAARPAPEAPPQAAAAPVPAARPLVTVNGSRTLISLPPEREAPGALGPAVPRPGAVGADAPDQPRYLADVDPARAATAARGVVLPGAAAPQAAGRREALSTDLPAQAYRGPTPPPFGW